MRDLLKCSVLFNFLSAKGDALRCQTLGSCCLFLIAHRVSPRAGLASEAEFSGLNPRDSFVQGKGE